MESSVNKSNKLKQINKKLKWYNFQALSPTSSILQGTISMSSKNFKFQSRGRQASSSSVVAIVFGRLFDPKTWSTKLINQILEYGDKLYRTSQMKNHLNPQEYTTTSQIYPEFFIADYKIRISIEQSLIYGNIFSENLGCPDLSDGIERFFKISSAGVVTAQGMSVAIWHHDVHGFFYFDPSSCSEVGEKNFHGVACVLRFSDINEMRKIFLNNLNRNYDSRYCIDKVNVLQVTQIKRGLVNDNLQKLIVPKNVLKTFNPDDATDDDKMDCTKPVPKVQKKIITTEIIKEPLSITISNYDIDSKFATNDIIDQNNFNTGYDYYDIEVNIPSTFKELLGNVAILHGWTHENSENYKGKGAQNVANCIMSIGMKKIYPVKTWLRPKLDEILALGDALHAEVKAKKPLIKSMTAPDFNDTKINIEGKNMFVDVDLITVIGTINSKISSILNLKQALEEFFLINKDGVVECPSMAIGVWEQDDCYYIFDPKQCDASGARLVEEKGKSGGKGKKDTGVVEKKIKGKCCVIRFPNLDNLVDNFVKNLPVGKKNDRFIIRHISIIDDIPGIRSWNEFKPAETGKTWILHGATSNDSDNFDDDSRGQQGIAMPISALISAAETQPHNWTKEIVDRSIFEGNELYNWCIPPEEEENRQLNLGNLKTTIYNKNRKLKISLQEDCVVGDLTAASNAQILNLEKGIKKFFDTQQFGIIDVKDLSIGIWKYEEEMKDKSKQLSYYLFDSNPRNELGLNDLEGAEEEPTACVIRSLDPGQLSRIIEKNIDRDFGENDNFTIHSFKVVSTSETMTDEEVEADKKIPIKPDLNGYTEISDDGGILSGSFEQGNNLFKLQTRDKQQAANALVTLAMRQMYNPHLWYREVIDDILKLGDKITQNNAQNILEEQQEEDDEGKKIPRQYLYPKEIEEEFDIGVNRVTVNVEEDKIPSRNVTELAQALEEFFADSTMGILKKEEIIIPIWLEGNIYFFLDPRGRDAVGESKDNSPASVMWFTTISSLASFIEKSFQDKPGDFSIDGVTLENEYETRLAEDQRPKKTTSTENLWHNFPKKNEGIWELEGNISLDDERFVDINRGKQSAGVALMSVVFSKVYEPRQWSKEILDEIVITGDKLFVKSIDRLADNSIPRVNQIVTEFFLSNRRIGLKITDCVEAGMLLGSSSIQSVQSGLEKFFKKFTSGVLTINQSNNTTNIAIWKAKDNIFSVISNNLASSSPSESEKSFKVSVLRFKSPEILANYLRSLQKTDESQENEPTDNYDFEISAVDVIDWNKFPPWKHDPSAAIRPGNLPPLNAYKQLKNPARAILRGGIHQGSDLFSPSTRNRQTAANCVVSLAMSLMKNPVTWTRKTLDEILVIGNSVHRESLKITKKDKLRPEDITRIITIGVNVLTVDVDESTVSGLVALPPPEPEVKGKGKAKAKKKPQKAKKKKGKQRREPPPPPPPIFLEEGLKKFFDNNRAGILVTGRFMIAIWRDQGVYFVYDPRARSDSGLAEDDDGTSCVLWFACIEPFYDLIFSNIDESEKYGKYDISRIVVRTNLIEPLPTPAEFQAFLDCPGKNNPISSFDKETITLNVEHLSKFFVVDDDVAVLNGSFSMFDRIFEINNRGFQSTAMAAVAIVVGLVHIPSTWTGDLIDFILKFGDILHKDSVRFFRTGTRNLSPSEILNTFIVGDFKTTINVHQHTFAGILLVDDLQQSLKLFFKNHCAGIVHTANYSIAIMQHYGIFYIFDPAARNKYGDSSFNGTACVVKCKNITRLAWIFFTNCNYKIPTVYTINSVNVLSVKFFSKTSSCTSSCKKS